MKITKNNAQQRADKLLKLVTDQVETGEFVIHSGYLQNSPEFGPCGCALAAAAYACGTEPNEYGSDGEENEEAVVEAGLVTENEAREFEAGFESRTFLPRTFSMLLANQDGPFYRAGLYLHEQFRQTQAY